MKQINRVFAVLEEGPAHSQDIADETGLSVKTVSAALSELRECGMCRVIGRVKLKKIGPASNIWKLKTGIKELEPQAT